MDNELSFDLDSLLPSFQGLTEHGIRNPDGLSAFFVLILWGSFFIGLIYIGFIFRSSVKNITDLKEALNNISPEELVDMRRDISNEIEKNQFVYEIWNEFDESLVTSHDGKHIYNVYNAAFFFSPDSLAGQLVENRLLAAMPAILTAIGVIGTFAGLQLGLKGIDLSAEADVMRQQISILIGGASVAFMTSVWGVLCSLVFNVLEKILEQSIRSRIQVLQQRIDTLFKRANAEQTLINIEDHSKESRETLQGLAERIGTKMQEAVLQVSDNMQTSLETVLGPAISSMVEAASDLSKRQAQGAEHALDGLIESFLERFSKEGTTQREMMESTSKEVQDAVANLGTSLVTFMSNLEQQQEKVNSENMKRNEFLDLRIRELGEQHQTQNKELAGELNGAVSELLGNLREQQAQSSESEEKRLGLLLSSIQDHTRQNQDTLNGYIERTGQVADDLVKTTSENFENISNREKERDEVFSTKVQSLEDNQLSMLSQIEELYQTHIDATKAILHQGKGLADSIGENHKILENSSAHMREGADNLRLAANSFEVLGVNVQKSSESLSNKLTEVAGAVENLTDENVKITERMSDTFEQIRQVGERLAETSADLSGSAESAKDGFESLRGYHKEFAVELRSQVDELNDRLSELLADYHTQVSHATKERMKEWNDQTLNFSQQMASTVKIMTQIIDDIDNSRSNGR